MQSVAIKQGIKGDFGVDPKHWFTEKSKEIDSLGRVVLLLSREIIEVADTKYKEARYALIASISLSLVAILFALVVMRDLVQNTEKRQEAENDLRYSEERMRAILENASNAIVTINENGNIESANQATTEMFGYPADEVIGKNVKIFDALNPYKSEHDGYLDNYLEIGHKKIIGMWREVSGLKKDGTEFPLTLNVSRNQYRWKAYVYRHYARH